MNHSGKFRIAKPSIALVYGTGDQVGGAFPWGRYICQGNARVSKFGPVGQTFGGLVQRHLERARPCVVTPAIHGFVPVVQSHIRTGFIAAGNPPVGNWPAQTPDPLANPHLLPTSIGPG